MALRAKRAFVAAPLEDHLVGDSPYLPRLGETL